MQECKLFNKIQELLESGSLTEEVANALDAEVSKALSDLRQEAKTNREKADELLKSFENVKTSKESLESQLATVEDKIKEAKKQGQDEIVQKLEAEQQRQQDLMQELQKFEKENEKLKIQNAISENLNAFKIKQDVRNDVQQLLAVQARIDGDKIYLGEQPLEDGLNSFFENRKSYLEPVGNPTGSGAQNGTSGNATITRSDFEKLPPQEQAKVATTKEIID